MDWWRGQIEGIDKRIIVIAMDWQMGMWLYVWYFDELTNGATGWWMNNTFSRIKVLEDGSMAGGEICSGKDWRQDRRIYVNNKWIMNITLDIVVPKCLDFSLLSKPLISNVITYHWKRAWNMRCVQHTVRHERTKCCVSPTLKHSTENEVNTENKADII